MTGIYSGKKLKDTFVFTGERSAKGYAMNKLASSLTKPDNREAFLADEDAYMDRFGLPEDQKDMIRRRDWAAIIEAGGNIYLIMKIAATLGIILFAMGAQMRGETLDEFMASRIGTDAKPRIS